MRTTLAIVAMSAVLGAGFSAWTASGSAASAKAGTRSAVPLAVAARGPEGDVVAPLGDIHFDTDRTDIRLQEQTNLEADAQWLRAHPDAHARVEGYADERGTPPHNHALGERRAETVRRFLVTHGVSARRLTVVSFGEERPVCSGRTPACLARNRRVHVAVGPWTFGAGPGREVAAHAPGG